MYKARNSNGNLTSVNVTTSQKDLELLQSLNNQPTTIRVGASAADCERENTFVNASLNSSIYYNIFKPGDYVEMNDEIVDFLNTDWNGRNYHHIAVGHILAGAILVEGRQILLNNGCELYNRKPDVDIHRECLGSESMQSSLPNLDDTYLKVDLIIKYEEKSRKRIIGTLVINALIISSLRLDCIMEPEVGPSTYSFTPATSTRIFISKESIKNLTLTMNKEDTYF